MLPPEGALCIRAEVISRHPVMAHSQQAHPDTSQLSGRLALLLRQCRELLAEPLIPSPAPSALADLKPFSELLRPGPRLARLQSAVSACRPCPSLSARAASCLLKTHAGIGRSDWRPQRYRLPLVAVLPAVVPAALCSHVRLGPQQFGCRLSSLG